VFKLQQARSRLQNRKSFTTVRAVKHCNKLSGEFAESSSLEAAECVGKITPKNDTCSASAPVLFQRCCPPGIPPALFCDSVTARGCVEHTEHKEGKRSSKSQSISFTIIQTALHIF